MNNNKKESIDCPEKLIQLANTPFERNVVSEFISIESDIKEQFAKIKADMKWIKWLTVSLFAAIIIARLI